MRRKSLFFRKNTNNKIETSIKKSHLLNTMKNIPIDIYNVNILII